MNACVYTPVGMLSLLVGNLLSTLCVSDPEASPGGSARNTGGASPHKAEGLGRVDKRKQDKMQESQQETRHGHTSCLKREYFWRRGQCLKRASEPPLDLKGQREREVSGQMR